MLSSIFGNVSNITRNSALRVAALSAAVSFTATSASAQTAPPPAPTPAQAEEEEEAAEESSEEEEVPGEEEEAEEGEEAPKPVASGTVGTVRVETGAPRPPAQTPGIAPAAPPPGSTPPPPTIKVGGAFILAYFQPYNMGEEAQRQNRPRPESNFETFRAAIILDSKINRFGVHIEFRARDKRVREFFESTAWLEEIYGSVDIIQSTNPVATATLKVGKAFSQFGRFWDDSFYGNVHLRDGLKLDSNYGLSLEGQVGKRQIGAKFFGQYFILDGGTNTSLNHRDTISNPAPYSNFPPLPPSGYANNTITQNPSPAVSLARRRNMFVGRIEPFYAFTPTSSIKIAGSIQNFTADYGPTVDQENVLRYGADTTLTFAWFSAWAEYTHQKGYSTLNYPFPPTAGSLNPAPAAGYPGTGRLNQGGSEDIDYILAGGRFFYKGIMLRYNYSQVKYHHATPFGAPAAAAVLSGIQRLGSDPYTDVKEYMHVPGIMISATQQLFLMIEAPIHKRTAPTIVVPPAITAATRIGSVVTDSVLDRSIVVTLHARI